MSKGWLAAHVFPRVCDCRCPGTGATKHIAPPSSHGSSNRCRRRARLMGSGAQACKTSCLHRSRADLAEHKRTGSEPPAISSCAEVGARHTKYDTASSHACSSMGTCYRDGCSRFRAGHGRVLSWNSRREPKFDLTLHKFGQPRLRFTPTQFPQTVHAFGRAQPKFDRAQLKFGRAEPSLGRLQPKFSRRRHTCGRHKSDSGRTCNGPGRSRPKIRSVPAQKRSCFVQASTWSWRNPLHARTRTGPQGTPQSCIGRCILCDRGACPSAHRSRWEEITGSRAGEVLPAALTQFFDWWFQGSSSGKGVLAQEEVWTAFDQGLFPEKAPPRSSPRSSPPPLRDLVFIKSALARLHA